MQVCYLAINTIFFYLSCTREMTLADVVFFFSHLLRVVAQRFKILSYHLGIDYSSKRLCFVSGKASQTANCQLCDCVKAYVISLPQLQFNS